MLNANVDLRFPGACGCADTEWHRPGIRGRLRPALRTVPAGQRGSILATVTAFVDVGVLTSAFALGAINILLGLPAGASHRCVQ